jgi:sigma-E factor negative regulatory protein RseA
MTPKDLPNPGAHGAGNLPLAGGPDVSAAQLASLSALADGQRDACDAALKAWAEAPQARAAWHAMHLSADVMRSDELASTSERDERFLQDFRARLALEPTVMAPAVAQPAPTSLAQPRVLPARRRVWAYGAVAAGFVAVGVVALSLNTLQGPLTPSDRLAALPPAADAGQGVRVALPVQPVPGQALSARAVTLAPVVSASGLGTGPGVEAASLQATDPQWRTLDGKVIRDARLDAYLHAHRGNSAASGRFQTVVLER